MGVVCAESHSVHMYKYTLCCKNTCCVTNTCCNTYTPHTQTAQSLNLVECVLHQLIPIIHPSCKLLHVLQQLPCVLCNNTLVFSMCTHSPCTLQCTLQHINAHHAPFPPTPPPPPLPLNTTTPSQHPPHLHYQYAGAVVLTWTAVLLLPYTTPWAPLTTVHPRPSTQLHMAMQWHTNTKTNQWLQGTCLLLGVLGVCAICCFS